MAQFTKKFNVDLDYSPVVVSIGDLYASNIQANRIGAIVTKGSQPVTLAGTCVGTAILANNTTVPIQTGVVSGNELYMDLPSGCYTQEGPIKIFLTNIDSGKTTTILAAFGNVRLTSTDSVIDPGTIIPSVEALIEDIDEAIASIPADYTELMESIAPLYVNLTFPVKKGAFCWYNGDLKRAKVDISTSEAWTAAHWENGVIADDFNKDIDELKSTVGQLSYTWTDGYTINQYGQEIASDGSSYATAKVLPNSKIKGHTSAGGSVNRAIAFYTKEGTFISADYGAGVVLYDWSYELDVPSTAYYTKLSCLTSDKSTKFSIELCKISNMTVENGFDIYDVTKVANHNSTVINEAFGDTSWIDISNFELGSLYVDGGAIKTADNAKRVRQKTSYPKQLKANSELYLTDYSHYKFLVFTSTDNGATWTQGSWITSGKHIVSTNALYIVLIEDTTAVTANVSTCVGLLKYEEAGTFAKDIERRLAIVENASKGIAKFAHFSFDDVRNCMIDLMNNKNVYTSIFNNPFFAMLKEMHDTYGAIFSLYLFLYNSGSNITDYPNTFASDFTANADWLKFGLHQGGTNYASTTASAAKADYDLFTSNIVRICGTVDVIDRCPRLGNFAGNLDSMMAMRDTDAGIVGLLSAYDDRTAYYMSAADSAYTFNHGKYIDTTNRLTFYRTLMTFEESNPETALPALKTLQKVNGSDFAIMMMHEYAVYTDSYELVTSMKNRISYACNWAMNNGYEWQYPMERILY